MRSFRAFMVRVGLLVAAVVVVLLLAVALAYSFVARIVVLAVPATFLLRSFWAQSSRVGLRSFLTTPSRARTGLTVGGLVVGMFAIALLTTNGVPLLVWLALMLGTTLLMLDDVNGAVANVASILARRPVGLTARGRDQIRLQDVAPGYRRAIRSATLTVLAILVLIFIYSVARG